LIFDLLSRPNMIRTITFGALCLAGLGAIAAAKVAPVKVSRTSSDAPAPKL
jgi:hypothetical protein